MKKIVAIFIFIVTLLPNICVQANSKNLAIENEPIDLVYKYIDLTDENLHRDGIPVCKKDYDNEEFKYSMRSVLKNIPWVRKIFVIMPNEKVKFLKDKEEISDKIVYIKDKDLLGFDSASSISFEFHFWKLKDFGCSENFIYMNDDYFIGKPLKKSDFFYVNKEGKVVPYALYGKNINYGQYNKIRNYWNRLRKNIRSTSPHSSNGFRYQRMSTFMFLYDDVFGRDIKAPSECLEYFPHNALGENLTELKELYDLVRDKYEYAVDCVFSRFRNNKQLQHQTLYCFYFINKKGCNKKIGNIAGTYYDIKDVSNARFNDSLYCINTGGDVNYTDADYIKAKIKMAQLFPKRTKYEKPEIEDGTYTIVSKLGNNKCLDVEGACNENGINVHLFDGNGSDAQKFYIKYNVRDGLYTITPKCSGKSLDVAGAENRLGANVWQYEHNESDAQKWYIVPDRHGWFHIVSKCNNLAVDVDGANTENWTNIQCWEINGTDAQKFKLVK